MCNTVSKIYFIWPMVMAVYGFSMLVYCKNKFSMKIKQQLILVKVDLSVNPFNME